MEQIDRKGLIRRVNRLVTEVEAARPDDRRLRQALSAFVHRFRDGRVRLKGDAGLPQIADASAAEIADTAGRVRAITEQFAPRQNRAFESQDGKEGITNEDLVPVITAPTLRFGLEDGAMVLDADEPHDLVPWLLAYVLAGDLVIFGRCVAPAPHRLKERCDRLFAMPVVGRRRKVCSTTCRLRLKRERDDAEREREDAARLERERREEERAARRERRPVRPPRPRVRRRH